MFGHLALGNLHVNVVGPAPDDERIDDAVLRLVADLGGEVAAEHGIGRAKARWLSLARSPQALETHARIKAMLDPAGVLNPGVLQAGFPSASL
jgi:FAD/FMN-containing dehydrogenase